MAPAPRWHEPRLSAGGAHTRQGVRPEPAAGQRERRRRRSIAPYTPPRRIQPVRRSTRITPGVRSARLSEVEWIERARQMLLLPESTGPGWRLRAGCNVLDAVRKFGCSHIPRSGDEHPGMWETQTCQTSAPRHCRGRVLGRPYARADEKETRNEPTRIFPWHRPRLLGRSLQLRLGRQFRRQRGQSPQRKRGSPRRRRRIAERYRWQPEPRGGRACVGGHQPRRWGVPAGGRGWLRDVHFGWAGHRRNRPRCRRFSFAHRGSGRVAASRRHGRRG